MPLLSLQRYANSYTVNFVKFAMGLRKPATSVSAIEQKFLGDLAQGKSCIVEVGVFEGATSELFCRKMDPHGRLYLVDPFFPEVRLERLLGVSFTRFVATRTVKPWEERLTFVREPSVTAAAKLPLLAKAQLIFIDARHDYDSVLEDFRCWSPMLAQGAVMAFHDSHVCAARPDLDQETGPVRLMREIGEGKHGSWNIWGSADSVTAIRRGTD
jgi:Methyltransferase domain